MTPGWDGREKRRLPNDYLFDRLNSLESKMDGQHGRIRSDMHSLFDQLAQKIDRHSREDEAVKDRVLTMETERKVEGQHAAKLSAWVSLGVSVLMGLAMKWLGGERS